jgi:hypothetical protein
LTDPNYINPIEVLSDHASSAVHVGKEDKFKKTVDTVLKILKPDELHEHGLGTALADIIHGKSEKTVRAELDQANKRLSAGRG